MNKQLTTLFMIFASVFIISTLVKPYPLSWLVKLIPMLLLIAVAIQQKMLGNFKDKAANVVIAGLAFSALGDFILDYDRINWFIFGLGAFFIAHICYLLSLKPFHSKLFKEQRGLVTLGYVAYGIAMFALLSGGLGELFIPVLGYMSILLFMAIATLVSKKSNNWLILGGISFVFSDSLLGFDKFYLTIPHVHIAIMISYYFAQYALLRGFLKASHQP